MIHNRLLYFCLLLVDLHFSGYWNLSFFKLIAAKINSFKIALLWL